MILGFPLTRLTHSNLINCVVWLAIIFVVNKLRSKYWVLDYNMTGARKLDSTEVKDTFNSILPIKRHGWYGITTFLEVVMICNLLL